MRYCPSPIPDVPCRRNPATAYAASTFPNAITALIDEERRAAYETESHHFETEYVLTVTHLPPAEVFARLGQWFVRGTAIVASIGPTCWRPLQRRVEPWSSDSRRI